LRYAREKGYKIKLVAHAEKLPNGRIGAFVMPRFVSPDDKLFSVDDVFNGIKTRSVFSDSQFFSGKGAGAYPTASAVLSDLSALTYDYRYEYKKLGTRDQVEDEKEVFLKVLWSWTATRPHSEILFDRIEETYENGREGYVIGVLSLKNVRRIATSENPGSFVMLNLAKKQQSYFSLPEHASLNTILAQ